MLSGDRPYPQRPDCGIGAGGSLCGHHDPVLGDIAFTVVLCGAVLLPIWIAYGWRYWRVFRKIDRYTFHKAVLAQPHTSRFVHAFHFTVVLENTEKGTVTTKTSSIFLARGWLGPFLEDYVNREVTLAYNEETGQVVVIR